MSPTIKWSPKVKLIISDVDETIADLYTDASSETIKELEKLLVEGRVLFLISGQSLQSIQKRIIRYIEKKLRKKIIIGHCSGAEVWGFDKDGNLHEKPFYSLYETSLSSSQKKKWRKVIRKIIKEFKLKIFPTITVPQFKKNAGNNPLAIMFEDRGPQITFEMVNGSNLSLGQAKELENKLKVKIPKTYGSFDLRIPIIKRAEKLFQENDLSITPRLGGVFAIDFAIKGVSKTTAVKYILDNDSILCSLGLSKKALKNPRSIEVWGDKFSIIRGGTDRHISQALPKEVRSITFRKENPNEFLEEYHIVVWSGKKHLHHGLLEFLKSR